MFKNECSRNCWLAAAVLGLLVWLFNATLVGGFVLGLITFILFGNALIWLVCRGRGGAAEDAEVLAGRQPAPVPAGDGVLDRAEQAVVDAGNAFAAGTAAAVAKGREALHDLRDDRPGRDHDHDEHRHKQADDDEEEDASILERAEERLEKAGGAMKDAMDALAARGKEAIGALTTRADAVAEKPVAKLAGDVSPVGQSAVPTDPGDAAQQKPAQQKPSPQKAAPQKAPPQKTAPKPAAPGSHAPAKPAKPKAAQAKAKAAAEKPDDLKEIKGIGPALEALLHENQVTSFTQIAGWSDRDIDHYAELIGRMGGRIRTDDWVAQAKILAEGGETEFSRRVDKGEVY